MRAVIQRVSSASLEINGNEYSKINHGFVILLAVENDDKIEDLEYMVRKTVGLRIFQDENDKMNCSILDVDGEILVVSQFTLYGDARKGNRPSFIRSAKPETAIPLYQEYVNRLSKEIKTVKTGVFGENMKISLVNDGPVTIILDSSKIL
ncbi:MAG: D-aminoacyl-tRNA deacylase [Tissierellia bacterium]|nr:D-aminoacyl-tRNA deacylase [Tissierellia bacterium]